MHVSLLFIDFLLALIVFVGWFEVSGTWSYQFSWSRLARAVALPIGISALLHGITALDGWKALLPLAELLRGYPILWLLVFPAGIAFFICFPMWIIALTAFVSRQFIDSTKVIKGDA